MIELLAISGTLLLILALGAWVADRGMDASVKQPARPDRRIAPDELALTGEDYRDHVADYFNRKYERAEIVRDVTGAKR